MKRSLLPAALVALLATYLSSPYVALYRLESAMAQGDSGAVAAAVDWDAVRRDAAACDRCAAPLPVSETAALPTADASSGWGWSFFSGPASFTAHLRAGGAPVTLRLRLENGDWRVVGAEPAVQSRT